MFEGNRRIENKFSIESASRLLSTLQKVHIPDAYAKALQRIADLYVKLMDELVRKTRVRVSGKRSEGVRKIWWRLELDAEFKPLAWRAWRRLAGFAST